MSACLITGMAGVGKSSVVAELSSRGRCAYDTDLMPGLKVWYENDLPCQCTYDSSSEWRAAHRLLWDTAVLESELERYAGDKPFYIAGLAVNALATVPMFDRVVVLNASVDVLCNRLNAPDRITPYAFECTPDHRNALIRDLPSYLARVQSLGATIINAERNIKDVTDAIISAVEG